MKTAVIIGAGVAGLATAIRLAAKGYKVEIFEQNSFPGGKLSQFEIGGYRFDAGPSLFTMPEYLSDVFNAAGAKLEDYLPYIKLDETCRYFYQDGTQLTAHADNELFAREAELKTGEPKQNILKFLNKSKRDYNLVGTLFLNRPMEDPFTYLNPQGLKGILSIPFLGLFKSMAANNSEVFKTKHMAQLFNRYATYNGSNPYKTPALLNIIPHIEHGLGAYFPKQGMYAITQALEKLARESGVTIYYNSPVEEILVENKAAVGIVQNGKIIKADVIVSNVDSWFTYHKLLKNQTQPKRILEQERSSSALIFYWGIKKEFKELGLHNIFFTEDYKAEFSALFDTKTLHPDPTVYINITSKHKPDDAPPGCENWFVMINAPANPTADWDTWQNTAKQNIILKLNRLLNTDLSQLIEVEQVLHPKGIEMRTGSYLGSLYGNSSNSKMSAFLRHRNKSPYLKNLYFTGGSVHPGGGIPLALQSAKIAVDQIGKA